MIQSMQTIVHWWGQRSASEQRSLRFGAWAVFGLLLTFLLILPGLEEQQRLQRQLPELRQQDAELRALLEQRSQSAGPTPSEAATQAWIVQAMASSEVNGLNVQVTQQDIGIVVRFEQVASEELVAWLQNSPLPPGMTWVEGSVRRVQTEPPRLQGELFAR